MGGIDQLKQKYKNKKWKGKRTILFIYNIVVTCFFTDKITIHAQNCDHQH